MMAFPQPPPRARPSAWWYVVSIGIAVGALFIAVGLAVNGVHSSRLTLENATRLQLGTEGTVTFLSSTSETVYYGGNREVTSAADVPGFARRVDVRLRADPGGQLVTIRPYTGFGVEASASQGEQGRGARHVPHRHPRATTSSARTPSTGPGPMP